MRHYRRAAHTVYELHYHFVFTTKYRKPVLRGEIAVDVRNLIGEICRTFDTEILSGHVKTGSCPFAVECTAACGSESADAGHQGENVAPPAAGPRRALRKEFWGRHLWARGYFVASSGNVTDEVIAEYIRLQGAEPQDDDPFRISD